MSDIRNYKNGATLGTYDAESGVAVFTTGEGFERYSTIVRPEVGDDDLLWLLGQRLEGRKDASKGGPAFWAVLAAYRHVRDAAEALAKAARSAARS